MSTSSFNGVFSRSPDRPFGDRRLSSRAEKAMRTALAASADAYERHEFLRTFHRLSLETISAETPEGAKQVLRELERALRRERARAGHWTYDLDRHIGLLVAYRAEQARAARIGSSRRKWPHFVARSE